MKFFVTFFLHVTLSRNCSIVSLPGYSPGRAIVLPQQNVKVFMLKFFM